MSLCRSLVLALMLLGAVCPAWAEQPAGDGNVESLEQALSRAGTDAERAVLYKKLGDLYATREDYKEAAEQYIHALSLSREFSEKDRVDMAVAISWGDRTEEAIRELSSVVKEDPKNNNARIHLARTLSWAGRLDESLAEIDRVLDRNPENIDALLVKANDLRWKGENDRALPLYQSILNRGENFDARIGYTYVLAARGDDASVKKSMALLKPHYPYQERELEKLRKEINEPAPPPRWTLDYNHYHDTDGNSLDRYRLSSFVSSRQWTSHLSYIHTEASDATRRNGTEMLAGTVQKNLTRELSVGAGLGIVRFRNNAVTDVVTGSMNANAGFDGGSGGVAVSRQALNETAELIEKRIMISSAGGHVSRDLANGLSIYGSYGYNDYSDGNRSHDLRLTLRTSLLQDNPRAGAGYRFRYLDFGRQSRGGYFDPSDFLSHQIFVNGSFEQGRLSGYAEFFIGEQSYKRYGEGHREVISGGAGGAGWKLTDAVRAEVYAEGGDYALQTAAGFRYELYGARLTAQWQ